MRIKFVLYITTQITGTWRYFSWCTLPNIWYARLQTKIIKLLFEQQGIEPYVKFYPSDYLVNPNVKLVNTYGTDKVLQQSLIEILTQQNFDLIITEACATTLLEILCTKSQVLFFAPKDFLKLDKSALELLSKRVFLAETEAEYLALMPRLLAENEMSQPKPLNDEFLLTYGIGTVEQKPWQLAVASIDNILENCSI